MVTRRLQPAQRTNTKKLIRVNEDIQPLGENPFGENISLYSGALSFEQTDVSLAGNGPTLSISRTFTLNTQPELFQKLQETAFGDWDINLPRITTVAAIQNNVQGWVVANGNPYALCTQFGPPPSVNPPDGDSARNPWDASDWWSGYQLVVPGVGSQDLLLRSAQNTLAPQISGMNFPIVTKQNWAIGCLPHAANDANREAFLAISPDGTQYTLDHLAYRWMPKLDRSLHTLSGPDAIGFAIGPKPMLQISDTLAREQASMLVTQIKDRFGNTLTFSYDASNRLTGIVASDGRSVSVTYEGAVSRISSITLQPSNAAPRTWSYQYAVAGSNPTLTQVTLPDLSSWHYDLANLSYGAWVDTRTSVDPQSCSALITPTNLDAVFTGSITHPSGLTGTFTLKPLKRGRSYVNQSCWSGAPNVPTTQGFAVIPDAWYAMVITSKQFAGAGLTTQTWNYGYSPANQSWAQDCATDTSCPKTVTTDVTDPNGNATRYTFSNYYDISESQLLQTDFYTGGASGAPLRSEANTYEYVHTATDLYPTQIGANPQPRINAAQTEQLFPLNKRVISQDGGDTYTWQGEGFDAFGAVTQTKRFSSIAGQGAIEEQTSYLNDLPHWVLGLPQQVINLTTGETESVNTYDLTNVTLQSRARFGQTLMSYTFNSAGQLASFTDGNSHTTGLSNYKRGIPQTISYPDATSESLTIDDFGQISAITDQAGHTTSYGYDGVGRISGITYPGGDEVAWLPKTFAYNFVTGAERGIPANHWRRTTTTGNAVGVTYFDAMLRPVLSDSDIGGSVQTSTL
ncbi:RHS repeat protein, partial [Rhodanobacter glycinis]